MKLFNENTRMLVIAPHADDAEIGMGGAIQKIKKAGGHVHIGLMTFAYGKYQKIDPDTGEYTTYTGEQRFQEFINSISTLGLTDKDYTMVFPDKADEEIKYHHKLDSIPLCEIIGQIEKLVKSFNPNILAVTYPCYDQDHIACYNACKAVARPQFYNKTFLTYENGGETGYNPTCYLKLTKEEVENKKKALSNYKTQLLGKYYSLQPDNLELHMARRGRDIFTDFAEAYEIERISFKG